MLSDYNTMNIIDLGKIKEPTISLKNNSTKTKSTEKLLDRSSSKNIKLKKPKKYPKND